MAKALSKNQGQTPASFCQHRRCNYRTELVARLRHFSEIRKRFWCFGEQTVFDAPSVNEHLWGSSINIPRHPNGLNMICRIFWSASFYFLRPSRWQERVWRWPNDHVVKSFQTERDACGLRAGRRSEIPQDFLGVDASNNDLNDEQTSI